MRPNRKYILYLILIVACAVAITLASLAISSLISSFQSRNPFAIFQRVTSNDPLEEPMKIIKDSEGEIDDLSEEEKRLVHQVENPLSHVFASRPRKSAMASP